MDKSKEELIFFNRAGSICTHAEEILGTDLFIRITQKQVTVNPLLTFPSMVMYINKNGKLKTGRNYLFNIASLRNDEWLDDFINIFHSQNPECKEILGVLTSTKDTYWYIDFVCNQLNLPEALDKKDSAILL